MQPDQSNDAKTPDQTPPSSPYGPQPIQVDAAAGGADSSPFETLSSDEREALRKACQREPDAGDETNPRH